MNILPILARASDPEVQTRMCLVSGAYGFVGRALVKALADHPAWQVKATVRQLGVHAVPLQAPTVASGDIGALTDWTTALDGATHVIHAAAHVHVTRASSPDEAREFFRVNAEGSVRLARQAAQAGVKRFVYLSSIKVVGEESTQGIPFSETTPLDPKGPYAVSKLEAEQGLRQTAADTGMEVVIIRPPLVYGNGVQANFAALRDAVARGMPLPLGALRNRRSLIALDNLVDFIMTCLTHPCAADQTFLISDGEDLSTADLARRLATAMRRPTRLIPVPATLLKISASLLGRRAAGQRLCGDLQVDITKARSLLSWKPLIDVDEGLRRATATCIGR